MRGSLEKSSGPRLFFIEYIEEAERKEGYMKNRIKIYLIIGFLIGTVDCLATWFFRFTDGSRSKWHDEKAHDIWLIAISAIQIITGVLLWPIKIIATVCIIIKDIITGKSVLDDVEKDIIEEY